MPDCGSVARRVTARAPAPALGLLLGLLLGRLLGRFFNRPTGLSFGPGDHAPELLLELSEIGSEGRVLRGGGSGGSRNLHGEPLERSEGSGGAREPGDKGGGSSAIAGRIRPRQMTFEGGERKCKAE